MWKWLLSSERAQKSTGPLNNFLLKNTKFSFVETPRKFIVTKLSIRKLGSLAALIIIFIIQIVFELFLFWMLRLDKNRAIKTLGTTVAYKCAFDSVYNLKTISEMKKTV